MKIVLKNVRLGAYPNLFEARDYKGDGKFAYAARFHVPKNSEAAKVLLDAYQQVAIEAWKDKASSMLLQFKGNELKTFLSDGDLFTDKEGYVGNYIVRSKRRKSDGLPEVRTRGKQLLSVNEASQVYGGCIVNAILELWPQVKDNLGMRCQLLGVQFKADADAFTGGAAQPDESDYEDIGDGEDAPTLGATGTGGGFV